MQEVITNPSATIIDEATRPMPAVIDGQLIKPEDFIRRLGQGTFGDVWSAETPAGAIALKIMQYPANAPLPNEIQIMQRLSGYPHLVELAGTGRDLVNNKLFVAMPIYESGSLYDWRNERAKPHEVALIVNQTAAGLQHMHNEGIVHRDLKPHNILIDNDLAVRVSDFGLAGPEYAGGAAFDREIGTPYYMAPEQCLGKATRYSDQYSLGVATYEWLTGQLPFTGNDLKTVYDKHQNAPVPSFAEATHYDPTRDASLAWMKNAESVVSKALAKKETERYPSVMGFAYALEMAIYEGLPYEEQQLMPEAVRKDEAARCVEQAKLAYEGGKYTDALETLEQATKLDPQNITAHYRKAFTLRALGRDDEATSALRTICGLCERTAADFVAKGYAHKELGQYQEAVAYFAKAAAWGYDGDMLYMYGGQTHEEVARMLEEQGRVSDALVRYNKAFDLYDQLKARMTEDNPRYKLLHDLQRGIVQSTLRLTRTGRRIGELATAS